MWQPDPAWDPRAGGRGASTVGLWTATWGAGDDPSDQVPVVVKRLAAPGPDDPDEAARPGDAAYWRREAEVALHAELLAGSPVRPPRVVAVDEDDEGITVVSREVAAEGAPGLLAARALGRLAGVPLPDESWLARHVLADRIARAETRATERGGWPTLARTTVADVADLFWTRRRSLLGRLAALPQVTAHQDATPANLLTCIGDDVVAVDWGLLGTAPVGADLGYLSLSDPTDFEVLLEAYLAGLAEAGLPPDRDDVLLGARATAVITVLMQAEWALARAAAGPGALAGKYRHPSVAPYLRALQRQFPHVEALLEIL